jgi:hypothetical protein
VFHEERPDEIIGRVCATIAMSDHIGLLLTKRTPRMNTDARSLQPRLSGRDRPPAPAYTTVVRSTSSKTVIVTITSMGVGDSAWI